MMRVKSVLKSASAITFLCLGATNLMAQYTGTLYSPYKYPNQKRELCLNFQTGFDTAKFGPCDVRYGFLGINNDFDWLQVSMGQKDRTVIRDIGEHNWNDRFEVQAMAALPKLQPGEQRTVNISADGADGATGAHGASDAARSDPGSGVIHANEIQLDSRNQRPVIWAPAAPRPKQDGKPKVDRAFVKAVVGHMYVVHVVDEVSDYYAMFRVDALENGACTVSWKLIPPPQK